jgi:hypothetical protein
MSNVIPLIKEDHHTIEISLDSQRFGEGVIDGRRIRRTGDTASRKLKVVCGPNCNYGWMKGLEDAAKPVLTPLLLGAGSILNTESQLTVDKWVTLKAVVREFEKPDCVYTSESEREWFARQQSPFPQSRIWIGRYQGTQWIKRHRRVFLRSRQTDLPYNFRLVAQASTFVFGSVLLHVWMGNLDRVHPYKLPLSLRQLLRQIWPLEEASIDWGAIPEIRDESTFRLSELLLSHVGAVRIF